MELLPITSTVGVLATLCGISAFFFWFEKATGWRLFQFLPTLIFIYLVPVILTNVGVLPSKSPVYDVIQSVLLPMLLTLLLLNLNVRGAVRVMGRGIGVMLFGSLGVMVGAPVALLIVRPWLGPDVWKSYGALSASWIGGSANMAAVSEMLHTSGAEYGLALLADTTISYLIWIPILLGSKKFADRFASFTGVDVAEQAELDEVSEAQLQSPVTPTSRDYIFLLCVALMATWIADSAANWIQYQLAGLSSPAVAGGLAEPSPYLTAATWRILLITTLGIGLSFTPLSRIPGSQELGMGFLFVFVARMGATAELSRVAEQAVPFLIGGLIMISIHGAFCVLGAKLFRTDLHTAAIASAANIGGVASASIVASYHRRSLVPAGIVMALIGYAIGNYCGYITGMICRLLM
ncbi:MAG: DUF819 family protein [Pirellulales bacterium]